MQKEVNLILVSCCITSIVGYYIDSYMPLCQKTGDIVDFEKSCKLGSEDKQITLKKIFEVICFENLNNLLWSKANDDGFFYYFIAGKKKIFYNKDGFFFYTKCKMVKVLEIKKTLNLTSCSKDLSIIYRENENEPEQNGFLSSSGIVRETTHSENCNENFFFYTINNMQFVKYKNFIRKRFLNNTLRALNITDPYNDQVNGFVDLYEKNVFSNSMVSIIKDLLLFVLIFSIIFVIARRKIKGFIIKALMNRLKSKYRY